jgi:hypothetical protein
MSESTTPRTYAQRAAELDLELDERISFIRDDLDRGEITAVEAATERIQVMEEHLEKVRQLRIEYFGNGGTQ